MKKNEKKEHDIVPAMLFVAFLGMIIMTLILTSTPGF